MDDYFVELAEKEFWGPFKRLKVEIVRQSTPALVVCGAKKECVANKAYFESQVVSNTNYDFSGFVLPSFLIQIILSAVIKWLIQKFLDRYT